MVLIRNVKMEDLQQIANIEKLCFSKEEAASIDVFRKRIHMIPDSFFVAEAGEKIAGFINGPAIESPVITDGLFRKLKTNPPSGGHLSILGLAVAPSFQNKGIATALLVHFENEAREKNRETITLTCKEDLIPFYEKNGYQNYGLSDSQHGGSIWYDMVKPLP